jgi:hypothetical protein
MCFKNKKGKLWNDFTLLPEREETSRIFIACGEP